MQYIDFSLKESLPVQNKKLGETKKNLEQITRKHIVSQRNILYTELCVCER